MKHLLIALFILIGGLCVQAQVKTLPSIEAAIALSKEVTELIMDHNIASAFNRLSEHWPLEENEVASIEQQTIRYLNVIKNQFGAGFNMVKISEQTLADVVYREKYLLQYPNTAIRLIFTYYKNPDGWIVHAFKWDDSFGEELD